METQSPVARPDDDAARTCVSLKVIANCNGMTLNETIFFISELSMSLTGRGGCSRV